MQKSNEQMQVQPTFTIPFTQVQNEVIDSLGFDNPIDKLVYISLLRFGYHKGQAWPSINKLAMMNNSSDNRIRQSLERLENMKLITIEKREKPNGEPDTNMYWIHDLSPEMKKNTIMNDEAVERFKEKEKQRKLEKSKKSKQKKQVKSGTSKNEPRTSKFEPRTSKNEGGTSKFEGEEYLSNKKNLIRTKNNNLSIKEEEQKPDGWMDDSIELELKNKIIDLKVPDNMKKTLIKHIQKIHKQNIQLNDVTDLYQEFHSILDDYTINGALYRVLTAQINKSFVGYFRASLLKEVADKESRAESNKQVQADDINPDWHKEGKHKEKPTEADMKDPEPGDEGYDDWLKANMLLQQYREQEMKV